MAKLKFNWITELVGGIAVALAMSYVLLANPRILGAIPDQAVGNIVYKGPEVGVIFVSTCLLAGVLSIGIGIRAWSPSAIACGMGLNSLMLIFCRDFHFNWHWLMGINLIIGIILMAMSHTRAPGQKSLRDALLRDPNILPASLSNIVDASVAGMLFGIAYEMVRRDDAKIATLGSHVHGVFLPSSVALITLGALVIFSEVVRALSLNLEDKLKGDLSGIEGFLSRSALRALRLLSSVKIVAAAFAVIYVFDQLYTWSALPKTTIGDLNLAWPHLFSGPLNFQKTDEAATAMLLVYACTVAFVLLFDVAGSPQQVLPVAPPPSVEKEVPYPKQVWTKSREESIRRGFGWEAVGNIFAPLLSTSPVTCYGENNVVHGVGDQPNDGARTGIPAIFTGLFFLAVLIYAILDPLKVQTLLSAIPETAVAVMLAWISLIVGASLYQSATLRPDRSAGNDANLNQAELVIAGFAGIVTSIWQGLALGLCVGIILVFIIRVLYFFLRGTPLQLPLFFLAFLASIAPMGQIWMIKTH